MNRSMLKKLRHTWWIRAARLPIYGAWFLPTPDTPRDPDNSTHNPLPGIRRRTPKTQAETSGPPLSARDSPPDTDKNVQQDRPRATLEKGWVQADLCGGGFDAAELRIWYAVQCYIYFRDQER